MAATLTAADAGADLAAGLRAILDRAETGTVEELRGVADELAVVLRRARGRITRLARHAEPAQPKPAVKPEPEPEKAAVPAKPAAPVPPRPQPVSEPEPLPRPPLAPRRVSGPRFVVVAVAVVCVSLYGRAVRAVRRVGAAAVRRLTGPGRRAHLGGPRGVPPSPRTPEQAPRRPSTSTRGTSG